MDARNKSNGAIVKSVQFKTSSFKPTQSITAQSILSHSNTIKPHCCASDAYTSEPNTSQSNTLQSNTSQNNHSKASTSQSNTSQSNTYQSNRSNTFQSNTLQSSTGKLELYVIANGTNYEIEVPSKDVKQKNVGQAPLNSKKGIQLLTETKPILWTQVLAAFFCAAVQLSIGVSQGYTGVTLPRMTDPNSDDLFLDKHEASIFSSVLNIGAIFGSIMSSFVMSWIGQRSTLLIFLPVGIASWILLGFAQTFSILVVARILQGLVIGIIGGCSNNYVVEIAHVSVRGRLFASTNLCLQGGLVFVYIIGSTGMSWRYVGLLCGLISMSIPFFGMLILPHSPRWLALQGRVEEAQGSLTFFRGSHFNVAPELKSILVQLTGTTLNYKNQGKLLIERSVLKRILILSILLFLSQFNGNSAVITYFVNIFQSANVSIDSYLSTIIASTTRVMGVCIFLLCADKFPRRPLFMIPLIGSGICMVLLGIFFYLKFVNKEVTALFWLPLASLGFFNLFTCTAHPILMMFRSELLPNSVRAVGVGILYFVFYSSVFVVSLTYPYMVESIGSHWTFWIYGVNCFLMVVIAFLFIPETQGKTLEEIDELFSKKK